MCHPDLPAGRVALLAATELVEVALASGEIMPLEVVEAEPAAEGAPAGESSPSVIVIADIFGPSDFYRDLCARLSAHGLRAVMPDFFFRQGPLEERTFEAALERRGRFDEAGALDDLRAAVGWARGGGSDRVGVLGFCMGGTFALDLAALEPDLAVVAYYGFPVPQATIASPPPAPLSVAAQMSGSILALWGDEDSAVGMDNVTAFVAAMRDSPARFDHRIYSGLGHAFLGQADLDDPDADDDASASWRLALDHLERELHASS
ncbi:MAG TPA: dienelactone hydrolase family protein [Solirubrobacteraceae bacterium]|nr:dienelactone hydrolase family protein [Solirubrobacteraceae bacterium]